MNAPMGLLLPDLTDSRSAARPAARPMASFAAAAAVHALLIALLVSMVPADILKQAIRPLTVRMVDAEPEMPKPARTAPAPRAQRPAPPLPVLATTTTRETEAPLVVPPQAPMPPVSATPSPEAAPMPAAVPVTAARFDADYLDNPKPLYPHASRRMREQGRVLLRVLVSAAGLAEKVEVKHSSGFARLDQAAEDAVGRWRFVPARRGEQAIAAWVQVPVTFQLES